MDHKFLRIVLISVLLINVLLFLPYPVKASGETNSPFITDAQLENYTSMNADQIRSFLVSRNSYFRQTIVDYDGVSFDPATVIAQAAVQYHINPQVILVTLQKESSGVTRTTRPSDTGMRFLMGCISQSTARQQLVCSAERFRAYQNQQSSGGSTVSGWKVGVAKKYPRWCFCNPCVQSRSWTIYLYSVCRCAMGWESTGSWRCLSFLQLLAAVWLWRNCTDRSG